MITRVDPLLLLLCYVFLRGQLVCGGCRCCPDCPCTTPSQTTATCNCSTQTSLQTIANSSPTITGESSSPYTTTTKASPPPSSNSSTIPVRCPTLMATDCPKCSTTISSSVTTLECPACTECSDIVQNSTLSSESQGVDINTFYSTLINCIEGPSPGSIIGAAFGGAVFGSILTVIVFVYIRRRSHSSDDSKEELTTNVVSNAAYQYNNGHINADDPTSINSAYSEIHHNATRKSAGISPVMRQEDTIKREDVYNHLHETDKEDRNDYYDHAGPAPSLSVMEDGYGVLSMESEENYNYNTVDMNYSTDFGKSMSAGNEQSNDYFILETQNE